MRDNEHNQRSRRFFSALALVVALATISLLSACGKGQPRDLIVYEAADAGATNIFTIDPTNNHIRQLTHGQNFDGNPAWSTDRKRIVFSSQRDGQTKNDLYVMNADGSTTERLTNSPDASEFSPRYSPDGKSIAFVRQDDEGWTVWAMNADGADPRRLAGPYQFAEFPSWTVSGGELYYSAIEQPETGGEEPDAASYANAHIFSVDVLTLQVAVRIRTPGTDACPHFSPDGTRLVYASTRTSANTLLSIFSHDVASSDTTGQADTQLTVTGARDDYGNPSPDGRSIVFVSDRDGNPELYLMDADGSHQRRLTITPNLRENVPDW
jgi:Tol biopolymer transport system component